MNNKQNSSLKIAVCAIMKNESPYILEWVAHYKSLGFDRILVYENDSSDSTPKILEYLEGEIEYLHWPSLDRASPQISAYDHAIKNCDADWILFVDTDEFLVLKLHHNIHQFITLFDRSISCVCINWRIFGSSGLSSYTNDFVISRFHRASEIEFNVNRHVKSLVRPSDVLDLHIHAPAVSGKTITPNGNEINFQNRGIGQIIETSLAQVNHYFTKSSDEWIIKKQRGNANKPTASVEKMMRYTEALFESHDRNECDDSSAKKYLNQITTYLSQFPDLSYLYSESFSNYIYLGCQSLGFCHPNSQLKFDPKSAHRFSSLGSDPYLTFPNILITPNRYHILEFDLESDISSMAAVYFSSLESNIVFCESRSVRQPVHAGPNRMRFVLSHLTIGKTLRIDPLTCLGNITIKNLTFRVAP